jgi:hypothetical protein
MYLTKKGRYFRKKKILGDFAIFPDKSANLELLVTSFQCILSQRQVYIFEIYSKRQIFFTPDLTYENKNVHPLLRPLSADRKTLDVLQRAETHFLHLLFFEMLLFWA